MGKITIDSLLSLEAYHKARPEMRQRAIAEHLGLSLSTVESDLRRAYSKIVAVREKIDEA